MTAFDPHRVARAVREKRTAIGLTQAELAEKAGLAFETISRIESGREPPAIRTAVALADALGLSLDAVIGREVSEPVRPDRLSPDLRRLVTAARMLDAKMVRHLVALTTGLVTSRPSSRPAPRKKSRPKLTKE